jgi:hypothetical protein
MTHHAHLSWSGDSNTDDSAPYFQNFHVHTPANSLTSLRGFAERHSDQQTFDATLVFIRVNGANLAIK